MLFSEIDCTSRNFYPLISARYANYLVVGKRTGLQVLRICADLFDLCLVQAVDLFGESHLYSFIYSLPSDYDIKMYCVVRNEKSEKYYREYFHADGYHAPDKKIYIFHDVCSDQLFSSSCWLQTKLDILSGIAPTDKSEDTALYRYYLNAFYGYEGYHVDHYQGEVDFLNNR